MTALDEPASRRQLHVAAACVADDERKTPLAPRSAARLSGVSEMLAVLLAGPKRHAALPCSRRPSRRAALYWTLRLRRRGPAELDSPRLGAQMIESEAEMREVIGLMRLNYDRMDE
jgi:hypothetical protein